VEKKEEVVVMGRGKEERNNKKRESRKRERGGGKGHLMWGGVRLWEVGQVVKKRWEKEPHGKSIRGDKEGLRYCAAPTFSLGQAGRTVVETAPQKKKNIGGRAPRGLGLDRGREKSDKRREGEAKVNKKKKKE